MPDPALVILYVKSPARSTRFYADLLGKPPAEASETFAMFSCATGAGLGLWAANAVDPPATPNGGSEIAFAVDHADTVRRLHVDWHAKGVTMAQAPVQMDFGFTFVALDPDGHRLRVFAPSP